VFNVTKVLWSKRLNMVEFNQRFFWWNSGRLGRGDVGIWGCGDVGIWGCGDVGIWGFGDLGIWGFGDVGHRFIKEKHPVDR
jgi:hypothetical protein